MMQRLRDAEHSQLVAEMRQRIAELEIKVRTVPSLRPSVRLTSAPHILCLLVNDTLLTLTFTLQTQEYKTAGEIAGESGDLQDRIAELQDEVRVSGNLL